MRTDEVKFLESFEESVSGISYDGWPIWWFFKMRFLGDKLVALPPNSRRLVNYNERIKRLISRFNRKNRHGKTDGKKIMFMAHTNGIILDKEHGFSVDRVESVVREVRKDPQFEEYISVISPFSQRRWLELLKYENLVYHYIDGEIEEKAKRNSALLHGQWRELSKGVSEESLRPALDFFFSREMIYWTILYYEAYKRIIKQEKIDLLCLYAGMGIMSKCAIAAAHRLGVKSLHVWHGAEIPTVNPDQPDSLYFAVIGDKYKEEYTRMGVNPENVFVTGPVFMDRLATYVGKGYPRGKKKKILLATSAWVEDNRGDKQTYVDYISKFLNELDKLDDVELTIKLHPREGATELYQSIIKSRGYKNVRVVGSGAQLKGTLYDLIGESDVVISFGSTVTTEAMIMGIPSLFIDFEQFQMKDFILNDKRILSISPKEDVSGVLEKILHDGKFKGEIIDTQNKIISEYLYRIDGKAGKRVFEIIKKLAEGK